MNAAERLEVNMKPQNQEIRVALLEQSIGHINETMIRIEKRFDRSDLFVSDRFDRIEKKFDATDVKIETLREKMDSTTKWLMGMGISILFSAASVGFSVYQLLKH